MPVLPVPGEMQLSETSHPGLTDSGFVADIVDNGEDPVWTAAKNALDVALPTLRWLKLNPCQVHEDPRRRGTWTSEPVFKADPNIVQACRRNVPNTIDGPPRDQPKNRPVQDLPRFEMSRCTDRYRPCAHKQPRPIRPPIFSRTAAWVLRGAGHPDPWGAVAPSLPAGSHRICPRQTPSQSPALFDIRGVDWAISTQKGFR